MAKQTAFLIIDTETTVTGNVADFGAIVANRKGEILASCGVLVREYYLDRENCPLFHDDKADPIWRTSNLSRRYAAYDAMLSDGRRMLASVAAVNRWLAKVNAKYSPVATAYNKAFDWDKLDKSGIDCQMFETSFCLWHAAADKYVKTKAFRDFILENHYFNAPTKKGNMTFQTNAEVMARFITGNADMPDEPHTALEDARDYELPILLDIIKAKDKAKYLQPKPYSWQGVQVRDWFKPK